MPVELRRRRFTVDEYDAMADAGILTEDDHVELIDGEIIQMAPIGSLHAACVSRLTHLLVAQGGEAVIVRVQNPVRISDLSEPEPDLAVLRRREDFYARGHPRPADTLLIIEVAHTTLGYDREIKLPLYALAGIPEVWIVDVEGGVIEVYRAPEGSGFQHAETCGPRAVLRPSMLPGIAISADQVLG
jgi:Uma2 family endonuclease